jgi:hypothetical protein|tara:strand:- start:1515 stop:1778 length:264 start_codon:yes stop_codon:yes gene_type:complete
MKTKGGITYIGVSLGELKKYFTDDAVIHVSKKFLKSYEMISGVEEKPQGISINIVDKSSDKITEPVNEPVKEDAPAPISINSFDGDW